MVAGPSGARRRPGILSYPAVAEPFSFSAVAAVGGLCSLAAAVGLAARGLVLRASAAVVLRAVAAFAAVVLFRAVVGLAAVVLFRAVVVLAVALGGRAARGSAGSPVVSAC